MQIRLGYPCVNWSLNCKTNKKFRLSSLSDEKIIETVKNNLFCLIKTLEFNKNNQILFFRISSDSIPFASHDKFKFDWKDYFKEDFNAVKKIIHENNFRISAHPGQFVVINSPKEDVIKRSIKELDYHVKLFEALDLGADAKIQIHVGGVYGDKERSMNRFIENYEKLSKDIKKHLVIENDDTYYSLRDCLMIYQKIGIPVVFDCFHHSLNHNHETVEEAILLANDTWRSHDGYLMIDYSSQEPNKKAGTHCNHLNDDHFTQFLKIILKLQISCDIMLEITDKEKSCLKAINIIKKIAGEHILVS